jgi:molybdopterin synthase catalytic subunit
MKPLAVVGPSESGKTTLVERLLDELSATGTVGTIKHIDCNPDLDTAGKDTARHRRHGSDLTYGIGEGEWFAPGEEVTLTTALDRLAQTCDYGIVEGYSGARLPTVALGGWAVEHGDVIATGETDEDIDVATVVSALDSVDDYETLSSLVSKVKASPDGDKAGAIATFTGRVRAKDDPEDEPTEFLEFEKYEGVAESKMATIRDELEARDGVYEVRLHHKTGVVEAGEDIVFVVVLAGHRTEAFVTVEDGIDRLKDEVPLFKKEVTVSEEFWAHE